MKNKKILASLLCLLLSLLAIGCQAKSGEGGKAPIPADDFKPVVDTGKDSELYGRYLEYEENATLAFKDYSEAAASDFLYELDDTGVVIKKYIGDGNIVVLPESIDGVSVVKLCEGTFSGSALRAVYIPDSVKNMEKGVFSECDGLSTLRLPFIGDGEEKNYLGHIFGSDSYDENAITVPASLDMLILGDGAEEIAQHALRGCKTLSALILPDSVSEIGDLALYECADLVYVSLGDGVESVGEYSFAYCTSLYAIDCSGVGKIGDGAFFSCSALNSITLNMSEGDYLGRIFGARDHDYNGDFVPLSLRNVTVAEGSTAIPSFAFASCKYITSVTLPESLETVGARAFYACRSLASITLPDRVTKIMDDAFFGCDAMVSANLGESLESLGMQAFFGCESLKRISLPDTLSALEPSTFYGCIALEEVSLGGVKKIGKDAFGGCTSLHPVSVSGITVAEGNGALTGKTEE